MDHGQTLSTHASQFTNNEVPANFFLNNPGLPNPHANSILRPARRAGQHDPTQPGQPRRWRWRRRRHAILRSAPCACARKPTRRDQRGRLWRIYTPTQLTQVPCANGGGRASGHGVASRRDVGVAVGALHSSPPEGGLLRRGSPGNRGRLDSTKVRRRGAGSAGRMTDHAGHRPDPASRLRYAVGVPYLYLFKYLLQRLVDFFQGVVRLFQ